MSQTQKNKIKISQLFFLFIQSQIGVDILNLGTDLDAAAGRDGWITLLIGGGISQIFILIICYIANKFPEKDLYEILNQLLGKYLGTLIGVAFYFYFLLVAAYLLVDFWKMVYQWLLPKTPYFVLATLMVLAALYIVTGGIKVIARVFTFLGLLLFIISLFLLFGLQDAKLFYLLPLFESSPRDYFEGINVSIYALSSYLLIFFFFSLTEKEKKEKQKTLLLANTVVILFYLYSVLLTFAHFGSDQMKHVAQPILFMLRTADSIVIARVDIFFLSIWITTAVTAFSIYLYVAQRGFSKISSRRIPNIVISTVIVLCISHFASRNESNLDKIIQFQAQITYYFTVLIPLLLFGIALFVKRRKQGESQ